MEYRQLGVSGLKVSEIGLGTASATFVGRADERAALDIIGTALDLGVTYFDTAETYAEGRAETLLGQGLKSRRAEVVIGTKFGKDRSVSAAELPGSRRRIMTAVEGSLRRLGTDYLDLYIMHEPDPSTPIEETMRALDDLVRAGKVRYLGCNGFTSWQLCDALCMSKVHNLASFVSAGAHYNLINRDPERELIPCCRAHGIGVVPTAPLAGGFLTGKYRSGHMPADARFTSVAPFTGPKHRDLGRYDSILMEANFDRVARLERFAQQRQQTSTAIALAWLLSRPWLGTVPLGVRDVEQLVNNTKAATFRLGADEISELEAVIERDDE